MGALGAIAQYQGQQQAYKAQQAQYEANAKNAQDAAIRRYEALQNSANSERKKTVRESGDAQLEALRAKSTALAAASTMNTSGLSVASLLGDFSASEGRYTTALVQNHDTAFTAYRDEMASAQLDAQSRINSMPIPTKPSFLGAAVRIAGAGVDAYGSYIKSQKV